MNHKVSPSPIKLSPFDWLLRFSQSLMLTAIISFTLSTCLMATLILLLMGLFFLPGLSDFATGVTDTILHVLAVFGNGEWWRGILAIAIPITCVGVLFDGFVFVQNHGQEAQNPWKA
ncbi:MAG: hypothetical protein AAF685_09975 [Cyanobacteria bacterium P01_C01_bin.89]